MHHAEYHVLAADRSNPSVWIAPGTATQAPLQYHSVYILVSVHIHRVDVCTAVDHYITLMLPERHKHCKACRPLQGTAWHMRLQCSIPWQPAVINALCIICFSCVSIFLHTCDAAVVWSLVMSYDYLHRCLLFLSQGNSQLPMSKWCLVARDCYLRIF